jgi:hypothetical protein
VVDGFRFKGGSLTDKRNWAPVPPGSESGLTEAPGAICASACFFAWLGSEHRLGDVLGIHRPFEPDEEMKKISPAEANDFYKKLSREIKGYLDEMDVQQHWLDDMMRVPPDDVYMIPLDKVDSELSGPPPFYDLPSLAQWLSSKCGTLSKEEDDDAWELAEEKSNGTFPPNMNGYNNYLEEKRAAIATCHFQELMLARWDLHRSSDSSAAQGNWVTIPTEGNPVDRSSPWKNYPPVVSSGKP